MQEILAALGGIAAFLTIVVAGAQVMRYWQWKRKLNWNDALKAAEAVLKDIEESEWSPDMVIGLGRSGGIWGGWIAGNLGSCPFAVVDDAYDTTEGKLKVDFPGGANVLSSVRELIGDGKRVLVIQGATAAGGTFKEFKEQFGPLLQNWNVKYAVLYKSAGAILADVDFVGKDNLEPWPKELPWHQRRAYRPFLRDVFSA